MGKISHYLLLLFLLPNAFLEGQVNCCRTHTSDWRQSLRRYYIMTHCSQQENSCLDHPHPSSPALLPAPWPTLSLLWSVLLYRHENNNIFLLLCFSIALVCYCLTEASTEHHSHIRGKKGAERNWEQNIQQCSLLALFTAFHWRFYLTPKANKHLLDQKRLHPFWFFPTKTLLSAFIYS